MNFTLISTIVIAAVFTSILIVAFSGICAFGGNAESKSQKALEDAVKKAAVQCYAMEGSYPPDIDYLAEHYGIVLNNDAYFYHYEITGSNIMPNIVVIKK